MDSFKAFNPDTGILANVGTKVKLHRTVTSGTVTQAGELVNNYVRTDGVEEITIRFDTLTLASIEEMFDSIQNWMLMVAHRPNHAILKTFMAITGRTSRDISAAVHLPSMTEYQLAVNHAYMQAMGVDKEALGKLLVAARMTDKLRRDQEEAMTKLLIEGVSQLESGFGTGSSSDATTTNSGDEPQPKSDTSSTSTESVDEPSKPPVPAKRPTKAKASKSTSSSKPSGEPDKP